MSDHLEKTYLNWAEFQDLIWLEMVLLKSSAAFKLKNLVRANFNDSCVEELLQAMYNLNQVSEKISSSLHYIEMTAKAKFSMNFNNLFCTCHQHYLEDHPIKLLEDYLLKPKLHVYFQPYPGFYKLRVPEEGD